MKYNITPITGNDWINIINQEAAPSGSAMNYYRLGDQYVAHLRSEWGSFKSAPLTGAKTDEEVDKYFDEVTETLNNMSRARRDQFDTYKSVAGVLTKVNS